MLILILTELGAIALIALVVLFALLTPLRALPGHIATYANSFFVDFEADRDQGIQIQMPQGGRYVVVTLAPTPPAPTPTPVLALSSTPHVTETNSSSQLSSFVDVKAEDSYPDAEDAGVSYEYFETKINGIPVGIDITSREIQDSSTSIQPQNFNSTATISTPNASTPTPSASKSNSSPLQGWPVQGRISQSFGCSPYNTGIPGDHCHSSQPWFHDGLDIANREGVPVKAQMSGTVIFAGPDGQGLACGQYRGFGLGVIIDNGQGWQAIYAHLSEINVVVDQVVTPDTIVGAIGKTGCVTGSHLHFGLRHDSKLEDPKKYMMKEQ